MIELIGAMIIIAVLTIAGITAVTTAINNSRITACDQDLDGFRVVAEQFLMENPQYAKWNGQNTPDQIKETFNTFNDKYLEGEMKIDPSTIDVSGTAFMRGETKRLDPWGEPYGICISIDKYNTSRTDTQNNTYAIIYIRSQGPNTSGDDKWHWMVSADGDDRISMTQFTQGQVISKQSTSGQFIIGTFGYVWAGYGYNYETDSWAVLTPSNIPGFEVYP